MASFPTQPDEMNAKWLSATLGYEVSDCTVEAFGEGAGIIGQVTRVHLQTDSGPSTIIAKFAAPAPENRAVAAAYDMYQREVNFYRTISSQIDLRSPTCYFAAIDSDTQDFLILMEDIKDMNIGDQVAGCTEAEASLVVESLARFAASTWQTTLPLVSHNNDAQRDGMMGGFQVGWPVVVEQFPEFLPSNHEALGSAIPNTVPQLLETMCQAPICISHADVRLDNVFFGDDGIALVDWQSVCTSAPEQDLAYFVTQSLSTEVRTSRDWVALFHETLCAQGITDYSLEQCRERFRISALYLACYATIIAGTLDLGNERGALLGRTLFGNAMRSLDELNAFDLLD